MLRIVEVFKAQRRVLALIQIDQVEYQASWPNKNSNTLRGCFAEPPLREYTHIGPKGYKRF